MATLSSLNSFSNSSITYQVDTQYVRGAEDEVLIITPPSWAMIQTMGNVLVGTGITATYTLANAASGTITFQTANTSPNVVTTSNVVSGVYSAGNIHSAEDWLSSDASFTAPADFFGNVTLTLAVTSANSTGYTYSIPYNLNIVEKPILIPAENDIIYTANGSLTLNQTQICLIGDEAPLSGTYTFTIDTQDPYNVVRLYSTASSALTTNTFTSTGNTTGRLTLTGTGTSINKHLRTLVIDHTGVQRTPAVINVVPGNTVPTLNGGRFNSAYIFNGYRNLNTTTSSIMNVLNNTNSSCPEFTLEGWLNISETVFTNDPFYGTDSVNYITGWNQDYAPFAPGPFQLAILGPDNQYNTTGQTILVLMGVQFLWYEFQFNTPMHVAVTRTTSNQLRLYVNGQQITNTIIPVYPWNYVIIPTIGPAPIPSPPAAGVITGGIDPQSRFVIGHFNASDTVPNGLRGYFDEVRLSNTIRYSGSSFTAPQVSFLNDASTVMLLHQDYASQLDDGGGTTYSNAKVINAEDWRLTWTTTGPVAGTTASYSQRYGQQRTGTFDLYFVTADDTTTVTTANLRSQYHIGDVATTGNIMITAYSPLYYGNLAQDQIDVTNTANSTSYSTVQFSSFPWPTTTLPLARIRSRDATLALPAPGEFSGRSSVPGSWAPRFYGNLTTTTSAFAVGGNQVDNFSGNIRWQYDDINTSSLVQGTPYNGPVATVTRRIIPWYFYGTHSNYEYWSMMSMKVNAITVRDISNTVVWTWVRDVGFTGTFPTVSNHNSLYVAAARDLDNYPDMSFSGTTLLQIQNVPPQNSSPAPYYFEVPEFIFSSIYPGIDFETATDAPACYESAYSSVLGSHAAFSEKPLFFNTWSPLQIDPGTGYTATLTIGVYKYNGINTRQVPVGGSATLAYPAQLSLTQVIPF